MDIFIFNTLIPYTKNGKFINLSFELGYIIFLICGVAFINSHLRLIVYVIALSLALFLFYKYKKKVEREYSNLSIKLIDDTLKIETNNGEIIVDKSNIRFILIKFDNIEGTDTGIRSFIPSTGDKNIIKLLINDNLISYRILLSNNSDYFRLKLLGKFLQDKDIDVRMKGFYR